MGPVVVIGASAGGVQAARDVLRELPADFPWPIVLVQHIPADRSSLLPEILARAVRLPVKEADDKDELRPGVYVAPPSYHLLIEDDGTLSLSVEEPVSYSRPSIDVLFESAAHAARSCAVGVILTGANADGAAGLRAIKEQGGRAFVQSPDEAEARAMPLAAIERSPVDAVLPAAEIGRSLAALAREAETADRESPLRGDHA